MLNPSSSIKDLFGDSWILFKKTLLRIITVNVVSFLTSFILIASVFGYYFFTMLTTLYGKNPPDIMRYFTLPNLITGGVAFITLMIISLVTHISLIMVAGGNYSEQKISFVFKKSLVLIFPIIVVSLLTQFLIFGGTIILIIPGLIFSFLVQFATYEVILNGNKPLKSISRSITIVTENFVDILIRGLILFLIYLIFYFLQGVGSSLIKSGFTQGIYLVIFISLFMILMNFFALVYHITLYNQYKNDALDKEGKHPMIWGLAIVGWVLIIVIISLGIKYALKNKEAISKSFLSPYSSKLSKTLDKNKQNVNPQTKINWDRSEKLFLEMRKINSAINDSNQKESVEKIKKLNDENILVLKSALAIDPKISRLWYDLGSAYTWISSKGTLEDSLNALKKAEELEPDNVVYINGVGDALISSGKYEEAVIQFQKTLRITQKSGYAYESLGHAYYNLKMFDLSKENYQKAIEVFNQQNKKGEWDAEILKVRKYIQNLPK